MHTTAVVHQYYGGESHFLPPELTSSYPDRPGGAAAMAIATGWVVVAGGVAALTLSRLNLRRTEPPAPSRRTTERSSP